MLTNIGDDVFNMNVMFGLVGLAIEKVIIASDSVTDA